MTPVRSPALTILRCPVCGDVDLRRLHDPNRSTHPGSPECERTRMENIPYVPVSQVLPALERLVEMFGGEFLPDRPMEDQRVREARVLVNRLKEGNG